MVLQRRVIGFAVTGVAMLLVASRGFADWNDSHPANYCLTKDGINLCGASASSIVPSCVCYRDPVTGQQTCDACLNGASNQSSSQAIDRHGLEHVGYEWCGSRAVQRYSKVAEVLSGTYVALSGSFRFDCSGKYHTGAAHGRHTFDKYIPGYGWSHMAGFHTQHKSTYP